MSSSSLVALSVQVQEEAVAAGVYQGWHAAPPGVRQCLCSRGAPLVVGLRVRLTFQASFSFVVFLIKCAENKYIIIFLFVLASSVLFFKVVIVIIVPTTPV